MVEQPPLDDMIAFILGALRGPTKTKIDGIGCDVYVLDAAHAWNIKFHKGQASSDDRDRVVPIVIEAAWELIRRGILKPGAPSYPDNNMSMPGRFSLTVRGRDWLKRADDAHFLVMQPGSLAQAFASFSTLFGSAYDIRSQEAMRCRDGDAWLATCAMCGAAAESILLALAIAKSGNEDDVLKVYLTSGGRRRTANNLIGSKPKSVQDPFTSLMGILSYWRDDAAHGTVSSISSSEAEEALRQLLRLSQFSSDHWKDLTQ